VSRLGLLAFLTALAAGPALADGVATVRVEQVRRGAVPTELVAYGEAAPAAQAVRSLTLAQPGQVAAVLVTAGQPVRRGQAILRFQIAPASNAAYEQAKGAVTLAAGQLTHARQLLGEQLATRDQVATAEKALSDARTSLAALAQDGAQRTSSVLAAPFDGVVATIPVSAGDRPAAGVTLATVAPASALQVTVGVEPGWRGRVRAGQAVVLEPIGGGPVLQGRVLRVDGMLNPKTRFVDVDVATAPGAALPGEAFRARIAVGSAQGWLVPHGAVQVQDGAAFVFQVAGGKAAKAPVRIVQAGRDIDVVDGALDPARPLVSVGAYQLEDGAPVRVAR
jgi:RND family efflux transporter MFP subunit